MSDPLVDTFADHLPALLVAGWVVTGYSRYDPTAVEGVTPSGKAFTLTITTAGVATLTIAGNVRTRQVSNWRDGKATIDAWVAAYLSFPSGQR